MRTKTDRTVFVLFSASSRWKINSSISSIQYWRYSSYSTNTCRRRFVFF